MWGSEISLWGNVRNRLEGKRLDGAQEARVEAGAMVQEEENTG